MTTQTPNLPGSLQRHGVANLELDDDDIATIEGRT